MKWVKMRQRTGRQVGNSQSAVELVFALSCLAILFMGISAVFFWVNKRMILRQEEYEGTSDNSDYGRVMAGSVEVNAVTNAATNEVTYEAPEVPIREEDSPYLNLDIFNAEGSPR